MRERAAVMVGFLSMNWSDVPPIRHLGNVTAAGVGAAFVLSVTFLQETMSYLLFVRMNYIADGEPISE